MNCSNPECNKPLPEGFHWCRRYCNRQCQAHAEYLKRREGKLKPSSRTCRHCHKPIGGHLIGYCREPECQQAKKRDKKAYHRAWAHKNKPWRKRDNTEIRTLKEKRVGECPFYHEPTNNHFCCDRCRAKRSGGMELYTGVML